MGCGSSSDAWEDNFTGIGTESITIVFDRGHDEVEVAGGAKGYPETEAPLREETKAPIKWFENESDDDDDDDVTLNSRTPSGINMSARDLKELQKRVTGNNASDALQQRLLEVGEFAKQTNKRCMDSFDSLIAHLTEGIDGSNSDLLTVRALIVWLANQNIENASFGKGTTDTPRGYLQMIKEGRATYASFFTVLCRLSKIDCYLIHGVCRAGSYQPGDTDVDSLECLWTAVYVQGNWQIIHPFWVCRAMIGQKIGGWLKLESGGKTVSDVERRQRGALSTAFKECYFMPKPEEFIYMCYPDEDRMQFLPKDKVVPNRFHFLRLPYLFPPFFGLGFKLITEQACELNSHNGMLTIEFLGDPSIANKLCLTYDLYLKDTSSADDEMIQSRNLPRLVFNTRAEEKFSFEIRFPVEGVYKLVIYGGPYGQPGLRLCEFKLNCEQRLVGCQLLPLNTGLDGWGPGPKAEKAGLLVPSKMGGKIQIQPLNSNADTEEKHTSVKFSLENEKMKSMSYGAELTSGGPNRENLTNHVTCTVDEESRELNVSATVPKEGEYGLVIKAGRKGKKQRSVCNYLLTTVAAIREGVPKRKARKALKAAMMKNDALEELANVIEKCHKVKIEPTDEDLKSANNRLAFLKMKIDLHDCHKRRNLDVTKETLKRVDKYRHKMALIMETRRAQKLKEQLEKLGGYSLEVPQLKVACDELTHVPRVSQEVHTTMKALFLLLDEPDEHLETWSMMQIMLKTTKDQGKNVLNRMRKITERTLDVKERKRIDAILHTYTEEQVRHSSQAAASFYRWVHGVLSIYSGEQVDRNKSIQ